MKGQDAKVLLLQLSWVKVNNVGIIFSVADEAERKYWHLRMIPLIDRIEDHGRGILMSNLFYNYPPVILIVYSLIV